MKTENEGKLEKEIIGEAINLFEEQVVKFSHPKPKDDAKDQLVLEKSSILSVGQKFLKLSRFSIGYLLRQ